ncbi:hypothetical protein Tco_1261571 [Tanacetum coccineum]
MSSNNLLDTHGPDMECSESATQLEVNSQSEAVEFYNSIRLELSSPKDNSYMLLEKAGWSGGINYYRALHLNWNWLQYGTMQK